jgi:hypothetical protein
MSLVVGPWWRYFGRAARVSLSLSRDKRTSNSDLIGSWGPRKCPWTTGSNKALGSRPARRLVLRDQARSATQYALSSSRQKSAQKLEKR